MRAAAELEQQEDLDRAAGRIVDPEAAAKAAEEAGAELRRRLFEPKEFMQLEEGELPLSLIHI